MGHAFLTWRSMLVLAGYTGLFYYISLSHKVPWAPKYDMPPLTYERMKGYGEEIECMFRPDSHPALKKNQTQ